MTRFMRRIAALVALTLLAASPHAAVAPVAAAEVSRPFAALAGSWTGTGTIGVLGTVQHATCDATYDVAGISARLRLRCTTESFRLDLAGSVVDRRGIVSGTWSDRVFGTSGTVAGQAEPERIGLSANVVGADIAIVIATRRGRQAVSLSTTSPFLTAGRLSLARRG